MGDKEEKFEGFIINPTYRIENEKAYVYLYGRLKDKRSFCTRNLFRPYFFVSEKDIDSVKLILNTDYEKSELTSFKGEKLVKVMLNVPKEVSDLRKELEEKGIDCYEADIRFSYRFMMDNNLKGSLTIKGKESKNENIRTDVFFDEPTLSSSSWKPINNDFKILSFDIESSMDLKQLYCLSLYSNDGVLNKVLLISDKDKIKNAENFKDEISLLNEFKKIVIEYDPDIVTGWNLIDFDLKMLQDKMKSYGINFDLGRNDSDATLRISESFMTDSKAGIPGRVVLDGIHLLKTSFIKLDDYKLGTAAKEFTEEKKLIGDDNKGEEIETSYLKNKQKLVDYNLLDSKLVIDIINKSGAMELTILRSMLTGMPLDRVRASIASLDSLYLRKLRKRGYAALSSKFVQRGDRTTGGYVMKSKPGIYDYVIVCDFKSLYPSIMITFNIDPLMFKPDCKEPVDSVIKAPNNACFLREPGILPEILSELWDERDNAKKNNDELTRWAVKILMNSFYGVMASPNCRFYSFEIANAITSFAHKMIKETASFVEHKGFEVIYGDTDSSFINLNVNSNEEAFKIGKKLEKDINEHITKMIKIDYNVESKLQIEFEKMFRKFLMPKQRGSEEGAKKRYAGLLLVPVKQGSEDSSNSQSTASSVQYAEKMDFTGLEFVRRDWTEVSKKFQLELLDRIFHEKEVAVYVKKFVEDLKGGKYDDLLVYRKALRKNVEDYTKTTPPHVKAARKLKKITSNIIDYVMTADGPEPIQKIEHSIDYEHYIEKQIKPIADSVLGFFNQDFDDVIKGSQQKGLMDY